MLDKNVPGPGKYQTSKPFGSEAPTYSILGKGVDRVLQAKSKEPGPGDYKIVQLNEQGKYPLSRFRNTPGITFGLNKSMRFNSTIRDRFPGPSEYPLKSLMDGTGYSYISKFKSSTSQTILGKGKDSTMKYTNRISKTHFILAPGPGSYQTFSEFGIYTRK